MILYLFERDFKDESFKGERFFCPFCLKIEGLMALFPEIRHAVEVRYVDFTKPRGELTKFVGENNQSCPQAIFVAGDDSWSGQYSKKSEQGTIHIDKTKDIMKYFIDRFELPKSH
ncbi:hypothetical protein CJF42_23530 [Pseudoalteromonas sp. NBT06-2]|nr:hypothetical protein CJF42_23530 [Pseudoalteromonas sp. NBT06-2]